MPVPSPRCTCGPGRSRIGGSCPTRSFVAERDQIVGFCSIVAPSRDDDAGASTCEIAAVYVDPDHWRAGIGSELLVASVREVAAAGGEDMTLWVFAENHVALAFYRGFGFIADGAETWHAPSGQKEIRLRAPIHQPEAAT